MIFKKQTGGPCKKAGIWTAFYRDRIAVTKKAPRVYWVKSIGRPFGPSRRIRVNRRKVSGMKKKFLDCNCWAQCCAGFGLGIVLAVFTSLKLVLILAGIMLVALAVRILLL